MHTSNKPQPTQDDGGNIPLAWSKQDGSLLYIHKIPAGSYPTHILFCASNNTSLDFEVTSLFKMWPANKLTSIPNTDV